MNQAMPTHKKQLAEVSMNQLTDLTGKTFRTIKRRLEKLEPVRKDGKTIFYSAPEALAAIYESDSSSKTEDDDGEYINLTVERAKLARKQTEKLELEIAKQKGQLIPASVVERVWTEMVGTYRARTLVIPGRVIQEIGTSTDPISNEATVRELIFEALAELRDFRPQEYEDAEEKASSDDDEADE